MVRRYDARDFFHSPAFPFDIHSVQFDEPDFEFHRHNYSEIVVVQRGFGSQITDYGEEALHTGDVYIFNGDMGHGFKGAQGLRNYNVLYAPEAMLRPLSADIAGGVAFQALFQIHAQVKPSAGFPSRVRLSADKLIQLEEMLASMQLEYATQAEGFEMMVRANFLRMVVFLTRQYRQQPRQGDRQSFRRAIRHINRHFREPLRLRDLAALESMSVSHFSRLFKRCFATSPMEYVLRLRILQACELLRETGAPISAVAEQVGFYDSNYFARQFKQVIGRTPTQYRRRMQIADPLQISEFKRRYPEPA